MASFQKKSVASCKEECSSYDEFMEYPISNVTQLNNVLRSKTENPTTVAQEVDETVCDFLLSVFFVTIAADTNSIDTVWFIQIVESNCVEDKSVIWLPSQKNKLCLNWVERRFCNFSDFNPALNK